MITELGADEIEAAVALWEACGLTRPWNDPRADLLRALTGPSSTILSHHSGDELTGTAMVGHDGHRAWVYYLAVSPKHRGEGIGRELMAAAEAWASDHGLPKLQLMVRSDNEAARGFYDRLEYLPQEVVVLARWL